MGQFPNVVGAAGVAKTPVPRCGRAGPVTWRVTTVVVDVGEGVELAGLRLR